MWFYSPSPSTERPGRRNPRSAAAFRDWGREHGGLVSFRRSSGPSCRRRPYHRTRRDTSLARAGATVVGPAYTVAQALDLIDCSPVEAAILDYRLEAETASPIAYRLVSLGIPFLFHTSSRSNPALSHPGVPIVDKPTRPEQLVAAVSALTRPRQEQR